MCNQVSQLASNFIYTLICHNIIPSDRWVHNTDHVITQSKCQAAGDIGQRDNSLILKVTCWRQDNCDVSTMKSGPMRHN